MRVKYVIQIHAFSIAEKTEKEGSKVRLSCIEISFRLEVIDSGDSCRRVKKQISWSERGVCRLSSSWLIVQMCNRREGRANEGTSKEDRGKLAMTADVIGSEAIRRDDGCLTAARSLARQL